MRKVFLIVGFLVIIGIFFGYGWMERNKENTCPILQSPVDIANVTSVLYPGQYRGGDYKAHGGFRLDGLSSNEVIVKAPISAKLTKAGRYVEIGEVQYIFIFETNCGLKYRFDHLLTLAPKFRAVVEKLPRAVEGRSEFVDISPTVVAQTGETIATAVGFRKIGNNPNVSFDFGVYLYNQHDSGLCWLDLLSQEDAKILKTLPGGDYKSGKTSDYCH